MKAVGNEQIEQPLLEPLTQREQQILELLAEGLTSGEIAERLTLAVSSVRWYLQQIYGKLGVNGKRQAVTRAGEMGLIQSEHGDAASLPKPNPPAARPDLPLPTGTVTFLFTDIVGSTTLWEQHPTEMAEALDIHNAVLRQAMEACGGQVFQVVGDAFQAVFPTATQAVQAAIEGQSGLQSARWNALGELKVRMGLHTGDAQLDPNGYEYAASHTKNRVARIMSAAQGGQILLSQETKDLAERSLPDGVTLKDMGEHQLKGMQRLEHLYQVAAPNLPSEFSPLESEFHPNHNLPHELTPFIGRQREITEVQELLHAHRLVTLTGSGGVGKTRLSIQVARQMLAETHDGVWFIELAPISDPGLVPQTVASTLGLREDSNRSLIDNLSQYLSRRALLLVLDNCEHLLDACARLVEALLKKASQLKVLASSREALGITGEYTYRVPSLAVPDSQQMPDLLVLKEYEAVRLFTDRAQAVSPSFSVDDRNALAVARICQRLDGIPLAMELAAARLNLLSPDQLASRLDSAFRLLTGGSRTALPRQQTLRATIDWSHDLLSASERILLRRLSVFAGGGTLEAVEAVCQGDGLEAEQILDLLSGLVKKSMVSMEQIRPGETRYDMLETVRQYAREKLYEAREGQVFNDRHLNYYLEMAETIEPQLKTSAALDRLHILASEAGNLRAALSWAEGETGSPKIEAGQRLATALLNFWHTQNYQNEGYTWLEKSLSAGTDVPVRVRARACFAAGHLILPLGRIAEARQWIEESLMLYRKLSDPRGVVLCQSMLGEICAWNVSFDEARELGKTSVAACRALNDAWLLAWVLCRYGTGLFFQGDIESARPVLEESLTIFERLGDPLQVAEHYIMLGYITIGSNDYNGARDYFIRALAAAQAMQSKWTEANVRLSLGHLAYMQDDYQQMQRIMVESVGLNRETGSIYLSDALKYLGIAEVNLGHSRQAALCFKASLKESLQSPLTYFGFHVSYSTQDTAERRFPASESTAGSLLGMARVALLIDQATAAAQLIGAAQRHMEVENFQLDPEDRVEYTRARIDAIAQLGDTAFEQAVAQGAALRVDQAIAMALAMEI